jgi:ABC-type oligopeptide transport system ATPase subunit
VKDPILFLNGISKRFERDGKSVLALDAVSLSVAAGETLALCGPSGSGKSTLARIILRLVEPESGEMRFLGVDWRALSGVRLRRMRGRLQMVFQDPLAAFNPRATVALPAGPNAPPRSPLYSNGSVFHTNSRSGLSTKFQAASASASPLPAPSPRNHR